MVRLNVPKETNATHRCCQNGHGVMCRGLRGACINHQAVKIV